MSDKRSKREVGRRQGDIMAHFIGTEKIPCEYERKRKQQDMLKEMNKLHKGTGVETVNEHGIETGLEV